MSVEAVVFDMDGTLLDSVDCVTSAYRDAVLAGGGPDCTPEQVVAGYHLGPPRLLLGHLLGRPATEDDVRGHLAALRGHAHRLVVHDGVPELLRALTDRGVPRAVFTGASTDAARVLLDAAELLAYFPVVLGSDPPLPPKPAPDGVVEACRLLGVAPTAAAYVGDAPTDLAAARGAGSLAVAAAWGHQYDPAAPADHAIGTPDEVLGLLG